ncbi:hippocampus abundant transcript-like protein 1 [Glycine soja]|uniref:Hippocampus abundant transcript-like protein 1 n=1 Tax=Glycine soja TaxID=3848 RepID=A0A445K3G8_GLYSO|nr:hippocampus abundant transcript-like protein 1 [Glycine soja]KHN20137.1 Hippocampus abundant transcript-like protein 1 [Glycine soja]RZC05362.1 Hippocampus abundant transcript-like protein 1 [Glycine soja]
MDKLYGLSHLFMAVFLHNFSMFMVVPAITDVTMAALCPGQDECSLAIYITGFQQAMIGLGTLVMMPLLGNLSDKYGRKAILTVPMILTIIPVGILAYSRTKKFFYVYYVFKILISMICEGSVPCLGLAYVADNIPESGRSTAFGILSGIASAAFVCGTLSARFLSTALTFQVSTLIAVIGALYMQFFLRDSAIDDKHLYTPIISQENPIISKVNGKLESKKHLFKALRSIEDLTSFLNSSLTITQAAIVAFFNSLADVGLHGSLLYFLKAQFHFDKNQFADLMVISGIAGTVSQLILMPILAPILGEARLLSVGLFFHCIHMFLYSIAWSSLVPYASAMFSILFVFSHPCIRSIVSKQAGPHEQGKAQGCISGICSIAHIVSPLVFSPLTALFLSERAPFDFPGFSIMCIGFASMISLVQSMMLRVVPPILN